MGVSGLCLGLFAGEFLMKIGHGSLLLRVVSIVFSIPILYGIWFIYSRLISSTYNINLKVISMLDSWSYSPLILTALMLGRSHWPIPRIGMLLFASSACMLAWIKVGQWLAFRKGGNSVSGWTYALPAGFAVALVWQMHWVSLNFARYLLMGQAIGVSIGLANSLLAKAGIRE